MDVFDTKSTPERRILDLRTLGVQDVPVMGRYAYRRASRGLGRETHSDHFEITYLAKGVQIYETEGARTVLRGGDLYLTRPGEIHSTAGQPEEKGEAYWFFIRKPLKASLLRFDAKATQSILEALTSGTRSARANEAVRRHLDRVHELFEDASKDPLAKAALESHLELLLLESLASFRSQSNDSVEGPIARVLEFLQAEGNWDVSIARLAEEASLSEARLKVRFKNEVGIPPGEYLMRRRIEKAKYWLRKTPMRVADIARELAFPTSQYFATVFRRYTDKTPQVWRGDKK
jgi:AraC-like DNA-binding protein